MLNMANTTSMEEIELYIEVVRVKPQVNQSVGDYTNLLVCENDLFVPQSVYRNQQNLYPRIPTAVAKLLQYSGLGSNTWMSFLRTNYLQ